ncbi:DUF2057 domain-containing protein [Thalassotalea crassostreae]|uniref:DUF2057 domain-containing protein n=1 Tax=Thalassotalea crassostreae TaxID=1763536 RepID=UPI0008384398|nr:DUF2057 domain-containing protein [Thalassotalea crassostreae]
MNKFTIKSFYLSFTLLVFSTVVSAAQLVVPEDFEVLRLNGEEFSTSLLAKSTTLELPPGQNVLVLKYSQMFDDDMEDHHITIKSKPFILLFSVSNEKSLTFSYPKQTDGELARVYAKSPDIKILDSQNRALGVINQSLSSYNDSVMKETLNRRQEIVKKSLADKDGEEFEAIGPDELSMLKYWWQQASEQDKQLFLQHIKENK